MSATMKLIIGIVGIAIAFAIFPVVLDGAHDINTDEQTDSYASVTDSGTPTYEATVTLSQDLYTDSVGYVTAINSGSPGDSPVADSYVASSGSLTISGLTAGGGTPVSRSLDVAYDYNAVDQYTGMESIVNIAPLLIFVGLLGGSGLFVYSGVRQKRKARSTTNKYRV